MALHHAKSKHNNDVALRKVEAALTVLMPHKDNLHFVLGKENEPHTFTKLYLDRIIWIDVVVSWAESC